MAIIGPADLPVVLKLGTESIKKYVLTKLGHPVVDVELTEDQLETAIRTSGDWIAGYFPREQRLAVFNTTPLQSTYPLPNDAYWVQEVTWDPVTTRIDDIFGAESFLFCVSKKLKILAKDGSLQSVGDWQRHWKAKTPYGNKKLQIKTYNNQKPLLKIRLSYDGGMVEATSSHVLAIAGVRWREFGEVRVGDGLRGVDNILGVHNVEAFESNDAIGVRAVGAGCYYGCVDGESILMH